MGTLATRLSLLVGMTLIATLHLPAQAQDAEPRSVLPLERGFFVPAGLDCSEASSATLLLFTGSEFITSEAVCQIAIRSEDDGLFTCDEACVMSGSEATINNRIRVLVHDSWHFDLQGGGRDKAYDFCPQEYLPEPWRSNDLSDL